jgi:hypothetical protein
MWSRSAALGLHRRSRTRSFPFEIYRDLPWVLSIPFAEPNLRVLDAAWRRLERAAAKSGGRRAAHEAYARRRRKAFRLRRQT